MEHVAKPVLNAEIRVEQIYDNSIASEQDCLLGRFLLFKRFCEAHFGNLYLCSDPAEIAIWSFLLGANIFLI